MVKFVVFRVLRIVVGSGLWGARWLLFNTDEYDMTTIGMFTNLGLMIGGSMLVLSGILGLGDKVEEMLIKKFRR